MNDELEMMCREGVLTVLAQHLPADTEENLSWHLEKGTYLGHSKQKLYAVI